MEAADDEVIHSPAEFLEEWPRPWHLLRRGRYQLIHDDRGLTIIKLRLEETELGHTLTEAVNQYRPDEPSTPPLIEAIQRSNPPGWQGHSKVKEIRLSKHMSIPTLAMLIGSHPEAVYRLERE